MIRGSAPPNIISEGRGREQDQSGFRKARVPSDREELCCWRTRQRDKQKGNSKSTQKDTSGPSVSLCCYKPLGGPRGAGTSSWPGQPGPLTAGEAAAVRAVLAPVAVPRGGCSPAAHLCSAAISQRWRARCAWTSAARGCKRLRCGRALVPSWGPQKQLSSAGSRVQALASSRSRYEAGRSPLEPRSCLAAGEVVASRIQDVAACGVETVSASETTRQVCRCHRPIQDIFACVSSCVCC